MDQVIINILESGELGKCPCCEQDVKLYSRSIYATLLRALRDIVFAGGEGLTPEQLNGKRSIYGGDYAKLRYWGLIVQDEDTGAWKATEQGIAFINGQLAIPKYVFVYNRDVYGFSKQTVTVDECRVKFKLNELFDPIHVKEADIAA